MFFLAKLLNISSQSLTIFSEPLDITTRSFDLACAPVPLTGASISSIFNLLSLFFASNLSSNEIVFISMTTSVFETELFFSN